MIVREKEKKYKYIEQRVSLIWIMKASSSGSAITMSQREKRINKIKRNSDSTSEVGSSPDNVTVWREFFAHQSDNFAEILRVVREPNTKKEHIVLPKYKPDVFEADAAAWCATADLIMADKLLEGSDLIVALSSALLGEASQWLTQICFSGITWGQFKELFMHRFAVNETPAGSIMNLLESQPRTSESVSAYASRLTTAFEAKLKAMSVEGIAVCMTLANIARRDNRVKRLVCTTDIRIRTEMQHELKAYSYGVNNNSTLDNSEPSARKTKCPANIKCHFCGKMGHKISECRSRKEDWKQTNQQPTRGAQFSKDKTVICYRCGVAGHIVSASPKREGVVQTKRVGVCQVSDPKGTLMQAGVDSWKAVRPTSQ